MPTFYNHNFPELEQINLPDGRRYRTPSGKLYPSVTTVLSSQPSPELDEWRAKVGEETANKISSKAAAKGSLVHEACENTLMGKDVKWGMFDAEAKEAFEVFKPVLDSISTVYAIETRMFSDTLEVAGTVDLIAEYEGKLCVLDWKTSSRFKSKEDIPNYFIQMSVYSAMFYEHTGIKIPDICVQMTAKDYGLITYWEKTKDWLPKFVDLRKKFKRDHGY
jgi:genome maintenance exonuclease 1